MKNIREPKPLTTQELFLLMRLLQHCENTGNLPEEEDKVDAAAWQAIYGKLNYLCHMSWQTQQAVSIPDEIPKGYQVYAVNDLGNSITLAGDSSTVAAMSPKYVTYHGQKWKRGAVEPVITGQPWIHTMRTYTLDETSVQ